MIVSVTRIETFSAAHRLHSIHLSDPQNRSLYGLCNNANSHGHNYRLETTLSGPVSIISIHLSLMIVGRLMGLPGWWLIWRW